MLHGRRESYRPLVGRTPSGLFVRQALLSAFVTLGAGQSSGQNAADVSEDAARVEATAFAGYRAGGIFDIEDSAENGDVGEHFAYALALDYRVDELATYELFHSKQPSQVSVGPERVDLDVKYLMFGGTLTIEEESYLRPYIAGLAGVARFSPDAPDASDKSRLAVTLGVGIRVPLRENIDIRLEMRGYVTFINADSSVFCQAEGEGSVCRLGGNGSVFVQGELLAGLAMAF
jgi:hypothetical protein